MQDRKAVAAPAIADPPGSLRGHPKGVGPYELLRILGSGAMSKVYLGRHQRTGQQVAIKILRSELTDNTSAVERFQVEFRSARKIFHPHVVRALDFGTQDDLIYLVLEYIDGPTLAEVLRDRRQLPESLARRWIGQVAEGLDQAHQQKLIHRDIKPGNILLTADGNAKLADLGLAKDLLADKKLTKTGTSLGTLLYLAPELYENAGHADARSDYYSLGVTLYQLLTGRFPFTGGQITVLKNKFTNRFARPREVVGDLSPAIDEAVCRLMQADPSKRPGSWAEFKALFDSAPVVKPEPPPPPPPPPPSPDNRRQELRYPTSLEGVCSPLLGARGKCWKGSILDLSAGGAQLSVERRFEVGSLVSVTVQSEDGEPAEFVLRVAWLKAQSEQQWSIGGSFHRRLKPSDLERLLSHAVATVFVQESDVPS